MVGKPSNQPFLFHLYLFLVVGIFFGMTFGSEHILISCQKLCNSCFIINVKIPPPRLHIFIAFSIAHLFQFFTIYDELLFLTLQLTRKNANRRSFSNMQKIFFDINLLETTIIFVYVI